MKMNDKIYEDLILRFSKEIHDVGVTDDMQKIVKAQYGRTPNISSVASEETTDRFVYRHNGYMIEAERIVKLVIKKCK